ncbi:unnamed protein product [Cylindrotheca closterium]|uniref:Uncharacterized protein n=1 Tax=Cylindrotheca closterium TaxID=2856 RepID=A0AAD2G9X9_9STRA|nr:unnamed protein product [Cylindrotheca closterium]
MGFEEGTNRRADDWNIDDLSQPWVSDLEEDDLASVAFASERSLDGFIPPDSLISKSPEQEKIMPVVAVSPYLESLMKRYPEHIPASLPRMRRKRRPLCLFVNFMGTRKNKTKPVSQPSGAKRGIATTMVPAHPPRDKTYTVPATPTKRQKVDSHQKESMDTTRSIIVT